VRSHSKLALSRSSIASLSYIHIIRSARLYKYVLSRLCANKFVFNVHVLLFIVDFVDDLYL